jgi:hypothetical protein
MGEDRKDVLQAAEVILLIIQYEGEIEDAIEYPPEFEMAYQDLLFYKIIANREGKYVPGENYRKASSLGFQKYVHNLNNPSGLRKLIANKPAIGFFAGAVLFTAGYFLKLGKKT